MDEKWATKDLSLLTTSLQKNVALLQQVQHLSLELKHAQKNQEESEDQISALKSELASNKNQANQQEEEKVLMKEEMESVRQVNL